MSSNSGVKVAADVLEKFNGFKLGRKYKFMIMKLSDDNKEIVVESTSSSKNWEDFTQSLINAKFKTATGIMKGEGKGCRYGLYDFHFETPEGPRNKMVFLAWSPDDANIKAKMIYSSSKDTLKRSLSGVHIETQANDPEDLEYNNILERVKSA